MTEKIKLVAFTELLAFELKLISSSLPHGTI